MKPTLLALGASAMLATATPAHAGEIFGGLYVHDINSPLSIANVEDGMDVQIGWRGKRLWGTPIQPYVLGTVNTAGKTHYASAGISAKFGDRIFIRPGVGIAIHTGSAANFQDTSNDELEFGSRILFEPELGIGARINRRMTIEASWVHMSHGQLFGTQNPGVDNVGVRLSYQLP